MQYWEITLEGASSGPEDDLVFKFGDMLEIKDVFISLKPEFVDALLTSIKENENYHVIGNIKQIAAPDGKDYSDREMFAVLGKNNQEIRYGFLFGWIKSNPVIVGLWPNHFWGAVKEDEEFVDVILYAMLKKPETWKRLDVILPIKKK